MLHILGHPRDRVVTVVTSQIETTPDTAAECAVGSREPALAPVTSNIASLQLQLHHHPSMSEDHMDEFEHYNFDQDKHVNMGVGGEGQRIILNN